MKKLLLHISKDQMIATVEAVRDLSDYKLCNIEKDSCLYRELVLTEAWAILSLEIFRSLIPKKWLKECE